MSWTGYGWCGCGWWHRQTNRPRPVKLLEHDADGERGKRHLSNQSVTSVCAYKHPLSIEIEGSRLDSRRSLAGITAYHSLSRHKHKARRGATRSSPLRTGKSGWNERRRPLGENKGPEGGERESSMGMVNGATSSGRQRQIRQHVRFLQHPRTKSINKSYSSARQIFPLRAPWHGNWPTRGKKRFVRWKSPPPNTAMKPI